MQKKNCERKGEGGGLENAGLKYFFTDAIKRQNICPPLGPRKLRPVI